MQKKNLPTNEVPTTTQENLAVAKMQETFPKACMKLRMLEYANNRGTSEHQFDILEKHFSEPKVIHRSGQTFKESGYNNFC
tara:strand:+ start:1814 stop:2056 length:243 start_codon:yes stop_codon:yes gene_type:complete